MADGIKTSGEAAAVALTGPELIRGVQSGGNVKITADQLKTFAHQGNLPFPSTQVASADANTLDDYEEGTYTPTLGDGTNNFTLSTANGFYTKIGRKVYASFQTVWTSIGSVGAAQFQIGGFPFTASGRHGTTWSAMSGVDIGASPAVITGDINGGTIVRLSRATDNAGAVAVAANASSATGALDGSLNYHV